MQITHEQAHKLIQFDADEALHAEEKAALSLHLKNCRECQAYAQEINEVESILPPVMKKRWDLQLIPLPISALYLKRNSSVQVNRFLATRTAAIGIVVLAFIFSVWQFTLSGRQNSAPLPTIPLIPTPATQSTSTKVMFRDCERMLYAVQEHDTLASIARQFAVSKEEIIAANHMKTETIKAGTELLVPVCNLTATSTIRPTALTTLYTPSISPTTSTPDG